MVKRQRERQYNSAREQRQLSSQRASGVTLSSMDQVQRTLPFTHCALTLVAFETPVCNSAGIVFENESILNFVMRHKKDPTTGAPMTSRDLISLNMDKDEEGNYQCPVLTKPFADHTKIVAIVQPSRTEANVYSWEAYQELNVKPKNWEDLISGAKFDKQKDVIILNDPLNEEFHRRRDINSFWHVSNARELEKDVALGTVQHTKTAERILEQLSKSKLENKKAKALIPKETTTVDTKNRTFKVLASDVTGVEQTSGKTSSSFTSTGMDVWQDSNQREATEEEILQAQFRVMCAAKKKGRVKLHTTMGVLTLELHCDVAPRTCANFLALCQAGRYNGTKCHRIIPSFMIQLGKSNDDTDASIWGGAFPDEFDDRLKHSDSGVLAMAHSGPGTNRQQFYLTFHSCNHLDRKHSVFGFVSDGKDVLEMMRKVPTDKKDRPVEEIAIISTEIILNPAEEARLAEEKRLERLATDRASGGKKSKTDAKLIVAESNKVGRYLQQTSTTIVNNQDQDDQDVVLPTRLQPPPKKETKFGDFSGW
jgi:peptidyl-prolyl cis-trans isomerase-like protein 2